MMTRFGVKNYKCLKDVDIPLTPIHVLIGQNDSGKTSLLEAMYALARSVEVSLQHAFAGSWEGRELVFHRAPSPEISFSVTVSISNQQDSQFQLTNIADYKLMLSFPPIGTDVRRLGEECGGENYSNYTSTTALFDAYRNSMRGCTPIVAFLAESLRGVQRCRFEPKLMALPAQIDPSRQFSLQSDGFRLAAVLDDILGYDVKLFLAMQEEFCRYFPEFKRIRVLTEPAFSCIFGQSGVQSFQYGGTGKGIVFETQSGDVHARNVSDGVLLFLGFLALCYIPSPPKLLLIEEPENGIYPKRLSQVVGLLKRLATESERPVPQIIMTTHSPYLISDFQPDEVTFMSRQPDGSCRARPLRDAPNIHERMGGEFYLGELWYNLSEEELFGDAQPASGS
jgi:energy-coupling factor transporter ATP-binding protein EcfA2